ncbi:hypothetical protein llap_12023 [Limosa lapponica baueri]|uniref:Uncharacterized protein n=1 Tax=Limosa lapponica baueri TaxID=1758121 RepID=A0A2I0TVC7_LIMLA|nr:hypothetical protein llap_12023 [Limosa lapponica baueri]
MRIFDREFVETVKWMICKNRFLVETDVLVSIPYDTSNETANVVNSIGLAACFPRGLKIQDSPGSRLPGAIALQLQEALALEQTNKLHLTSAKRCSCTCLGARVIRNPEDEQMFLRGDEVFAFASGERQADVRGVEAESHSAGAHQLLTELYSVPVNGHYGLLFSR